MVDHYPFGLTIECTDALPPADLTETERLELAETSCDDAPDMHPAPVRRCERKGGAGALAGVLWVILLAGLCGGLLWVMLVWNLPAHAAPIALETATPTLRPTCTRIPDYTATPAPVIVYVRTGWKYGKLTLRQEPGRGYVITLDEGDPLELLEVRGDWLHVTSGGYEGWVWARMTTYGK